MKSYMNIIVLCLALFGCVLADSVVGPGCSVSITTTARAGGSFQSGSGVSQIYDIVITNSGRCSADAIAINIDLLAAGSITEKWNLESGTRFYTVTSFGATLPVGNSVNAGIIVNFPNTQNVPANAVSTTVYGTLCPSECVNAGQTATTSSVPPSPTTGTAPSSTTGGSGSSGSSDDDEGSNGDGSCAASVVLTARSGGSFATGSGMSQIYDASITNSGSCGITNIIIQLALPANGQITSSWNLVDNGGLKYTVTSYEGLLPAGSTVNAGFIVNFPNTQTIPAGVTAAASTTACPASCSAPGTGSGSATTGSEPSPVTTGLPSSTTGSQQPAGCTVSSTTTARAGSSFQSGSGVSQIYDIVVTNSGSCAVNNIILTASLPSGASIQSTWNLNLNAGGGLSYTVTSYEGTLPAGSSVNAGFIVNFPNTQTVPAGVNTAATTTTCNQCAARR
eukprot:TRINITY_DN3270_c0_g1_i2.p1 TRINITY_DN3270_c0_g1~~TRINITY_DN3270_c0_g1_i2.p1  ORF type:complete len:450 (+),score=117.88 TRINITY_DN3270_c0_g1_i2:135-1484(+)